MSPRICLDLLAGWLIPGGGHLFRKEYVRAAFLFFAVVGVFLAGVLSGGANVAPRPEELAGMDGTAVLLARAGHLVKWLAGGPFLLARAGGYERGFFAGQFHPYGTRLLVFAGLLNLLALCHLWESRPKQSK
jgi:hypothetical protein